MFEKAHIRLSKEICNYDSSFPLKINSSLRFSSFKLYVWKCNVSVTFKSSKIY